MAQRTDEQIDPKVVSEAMAKLLGEPTISIRDYAQLMGVALNSAYRSVHLGEVEVIRVGRLTRIPSAPLRKKLGVK